MTTTRTQPIIFAKAGIQPGGAGIASLDPRFGGDDGRLPDEPSARCLRSRAQRGVTLIEVLVTMALVALMSGGAFLGIGALRNARLRESSTLLAGAIRVAYNHANATSRTTRLVLDFAARTISVEDSPGRMMLQTGDRTGGAAAATDLEREVVEASEEILEGPRKPRAQFSPIKSLLGFEYQSGGGEAKKPLAEGIYFRRVEVEHEEEPVLEDRVYLYFFPGGLAERAAVQIQQGEGEVDEDDVITVLVSPLTGKTSILGGSIDMPRPMSDEDASERMDTGF